MRVFGIFENANPLPTMSYKARVMFLEASKAVNPCGINRYDFNWHDLAGIFNIVIVKSNYRLTGIIIRYCISNSGKV